MINVICLGLKKGRLDSSIENILRTGVSTVIRRLLNANKTEGAWMKMLIKMKPHIEYFCISS